MNPTGVTVFVNILLSQTIKGKSNTTVNVVTMFLLPPILTTPELCLLPLLWIDVTISNVVSGDMVVPF